jgi:N-acetyl-gamma-glutamyl-phosphate reductase
MAAKIFIDGAAGTTGLEIRERLAGRKEFSVFQLEGDERKDAAARARALNAADVAILCLPDAAAKEAVALIENPDARVIDASSAHRTAPGWTYGFPELEPGRAAEIAAAKRVSNPGCYPSGFLALVRPLTRAGLIPADYPLTVNAVSGYSGGGRGMIEEFEKQDAPTFTKAVVRPYAYGLAHKHVPEMREHAKLSHSPVFAPSVGRFYRGMLVEVPLQLWSLPGKLLVADIQALLEDAYRGLPLVAVASAAESAGVKVLDAEGMKGTDRLKLYVFGNDTVGQVRLAAVLDNLGKGAAGAAVQNLNIMLGLEPTAGLA